METDFANLDNSETITKELEEEFEKEIVEDVKNIGDVSDISQEVPSVEKLNELKKLLDTMPREQIKQLMDSLSSGGKTAINPNGNSFSSVSQREMLQIKMKQKRDQYNYSRMTKHARETATVKKTLDKNNHGTQNANTPSKNPTHEHPHVHTKDCAHEDDHSHDNVQVHSHDHIHTQDCAH